MFAFAGASTFPTIQADMADRSKFNISAIIAMGILFLIYFPMAVGGYYSLGSMVSFFHLILLLELFLAALAALYLPLSLRPDSCDITSSTTGNTYIPDLPDLPDLHDLLT